MNLKSYIDAERGNGTSLAATLRIPISYLSQMASGNRAISPERAVAIEGATGGQVTRKELFPDSWQRIWPELARSKRAKVQAQPTQSAQAGQGVDLDQSVLAGPSTMDLTQ